MAEDVPPSTQPAAAAVAKASRRGKYLKVSDRVFFFLFVCLERRHFGRFVSLPSECRHRFLACVHTEKPRPPPKHVDTSRDGHVIIIPGLKVD